MPFEDGIKTVSGAICNIRDGAPKVGLESWQVTLPASLSGYSEIGCTKINSDNLFLLPENDFSVNSVDFKMQNNSLVIDGTVSGGSNISSKNQAFKDYFSFGLPAGTYYFTRGTWSKATYVYKLSDDTTSLVTNNGSFTLTEYTVVYIGFYIALNTVIDNVTFDGYLKQGSSASSYSPQPKPTTATASLGRTIYGGTADVVTGEGSADGAVVTLDDTMSYGINLGTDTNRIAVSFYNSVGKINGTFASNVLTVGENTTGGYKSEPWVIWGSTSAARMWISVPTNIDTVDKFKQYVQNNTITIVYELATATAFTFTPITPTPETPLGVSNWWSVGTSEISYHDNAHGFASVTVTKQAPDQADEVKTAYLHKVIFGGLVDVVKGKAEPKNWIDDNLSNLEPGTINGNTGADESANNRVRNINAIPFPYDEIASSYRWTFPSGYKAAIRPFDANGNYVSLPYWAVGFVASLPQDLIGQGIVAMKFVLAKNDNSAITPNDMKNVGYLLEKGSTATSYAPFFSPFSFPPISMETDEGENTLYADEGDSAITYRKAVD